jgi:excisionase family DNA binding protein
MVVTVMEPDTLLTSAEVARRFGVDVKTVSRWANAGKLPYFRTLGGHHRFRLADVEQLLAERKGGVHSPHARSSEAARGVGPAPSAEVATGGSAAAPGGSSERLPRPRQG